MRYAGVPNQPRRIKNVRRFSIAATQEPLTKDDDRSPNLNGPDASNGQPPTLDEYEEIDFWPLAGLIEKALRGQSAFGSDPRLPQSEEGVRGLWKILREKHEAEPLTPLEAAYAKRRRTVECLRNATGKPDTKKRDLEQMQQSLKKQNQKVRELKARELPLHSPSPGATPETPSETRRRTLDKLLGDIERTFTQRRKLTGRRLQWRPAPPGTLSVGNLVRYYEEKRRWNPEVKYDLNRIEKAKELGPDDPPWEGPDGFDGYVIFTFPGTPKALMECAEIGNAAYVLYKDWENWSQKNKQELMAEADQGGDVVRIPHQGEDWFDKIKKELGFE